MIDGAVSCRLAGGFAASTGSADTTQHKPVWHECIHSTYIDGLAGVGTDARGLGTPKLNTSSSDGSRRPQRICERFVIIDAARSGFERARGPLVPLAAALLEDLEERHSGSLVTPARRGRARPVQGTPVPR